MANKFADVVNVAADTAATDAVAAGVANAAVNTNVNIGAVAFADTTNINAVGFNVAADNTSSVNADATRNADGDNLY